VLCIPGRHGPDLQRRVACRAKSLLDTTLPGSEGRALIKILTKMTEEEIEIEQGNGELLIQASGRKTGIRMEAEITLGVGAVERPTTWWIYRPSLARPFQSYTSARHGQNEVSLRTNVCAHRARLVEACDNFQITRYELPTGP